MRRTKKSVATPESSVQPHTNAGITAIVEGLNVEKRYNNFRLFKGETHEDAAKSAMDSAYTFVS